MNFQVTSEAHPNSHILLNVVLDSFELHIRSDQETMEPDLNHIHGSHFNMLISETGKGLDVEGARSIEFEITPGTKRNVEMLFTFLFPRLPENKVRTGESWVLTDTIVEVYKGEEMKMILTNQSTFETVESMNGVACARIVTSISGVRNGSTQAQGVPISTTGSVSGSGIFYVALDEGYIVRDESRIVVDGTLTVEGPQVQTFPMQLNIKTTTEWIQ